MARNGIGSLSKFQSPLASASSRSTASSATPVIAPLGSSSEPSRIAELRADVVEPVFLLQVDRDLGARRLVAGQHLGLDVGHVARPCSAPSGPRRRSRRRSSPCWCRRCTSIGTRSSSSTLSTPMCAAPRAPPPDSTRPMRGRGAASAGSAGAEAAGAGGVTAGPPPRPLGSSAAAAGGSHSEPAARMAATRRQTRPVRSAATGSGTDMGCMRQRSKTRWTAGEQVQGHCRRKGALHAHRLVDRPCERRR